MVARRENNDMLYSVPELKRLKDVPHMHEYRAWRDSLDKTDPNAYGRIHAELDNRFEGKEVDTSSWIPGTDWTGTVFDPIYHACGQNEVSAALFFGLLVWQVVMDRADCWSFGRYEKDGIPIKGMTYFRIDCP
jgi:hypothetical protein